MYYNSYFGFGWIFMVIFWVLLIWALVAFVRWPKGRHCLHCGHHGRHDSRYSHHQGAHGSDALSLLQERYAKGEISQAEYQEKKKDLID